MSVSCAIGPKIENWSECRVRVNEKRANFRSKPNGSYSPPFLTLYHSDIYEIAKMSLPFFNTEMLRRTRENIALFHVNCASNIKHEPSNPNLITAEHHS